MPPAPPRFSAAVPREAVPEGVPAPVDESALDPSVRTWLAGLEAATREGPQEGESWLALGDGMLAHGESAAAAVAYQGAFAWLPADHPQLERAGYLRAIALEDSGASEEAIDILSSLAEGSVTSQVHWRLALLRSANGDFDPAIAAAQRAVELAADDPQPQAALAQIASEYGAWEIAEQAARAGLRANPRSGHLYGILAAALRARGDAADAETYAGAGRSSRADWLDPWLANLRELRRGSGAASERFYEALRRQDLAAANHALEVYAEAVGDPASPRLALMRAQLGFARGDLVTLEPLLVNAESEESLRCDAAAVRAMVAARLVATEADVEPIVASLANLDCEGDQNATRWELISKFRLAQRRWAEAAEAVITADRARDAGVGAAMRSAAVAMRQARAFAPALQVVLRLREVEPLAPDVHLLHATIALGSGDVAAARAAAAQLAELAPNAPATQQVLRAIEQATRSPSGGSPAR